MTQEKTERVFLPSSELMVRHLQVPVLDKNKWQKTNMGGEEEKKCKELNIRLQLSFNSLSRFPFFPFYLYIMLSVCMDLAL